MADAKKPTAVAKKKSAPKKATDSQVVKYLTALQRKPISTADRSAVTQVIRLLS